MLEFPIETIDYHPEIVEFVNHQCNSSPGTNILHDRNMKRRDTKVKLVQELGACGPIMDLVIRGTVNHMLAENFAEETKQVTSDNKGSLKGFLLRHFKTDELRETIEKWMKSARCNSDYQHLYRHKRAELINNQIWFLSQSPYKLVSDVLMLPCFDVIVCLFLLYRHYLLLKCSRIYQG